MSVNNIQQVLKQREAWKYADLKMYLDNNNISHEFEYLVGEHFIYDLVLFDYRTLVEFDGKCHNTRKMMMDDFEKDTVAEENGYDMIRIRTDDNLVIPADNLAGILVSYNII